MNLNESSAVGFMHSHIGLPSLDAVHRLLLEDTATSNMSMPMPTWCTLPTLTLCATVSYYVSVLYRFRSSQKSAFGIRKQEGTVPPVLAFFLIPIWSTLRMLFDAERYVSTISRYRSRLTAVQVPLPLAGIYLVQDPEAVAALWRHKLLATPIYVYSIALKHLFGIPASALRLYQRDDSGPYRAPYPTTNMEAHNRIDHITHESLARAFSGPGLKPLFKRFSTRLQANLDTITNIDPERQPDLLSFVRDLLGEAIIQAIYGPAMIELNPRLMKDLWRFDSDIVWFSKWLPRWLIPSAYANRDRLHSYVRKWYDHARKHFKESSVHEDGDGDPFWGSFLMRQRQEQFKMFEGQTDESLAAADFGLMWTSITNVVPSAMMMVFHIFKDADLLARIRCCVDQAVTYRDGAPDVNMDMLMKNPLLQAVYAEILRCYVQAFITRCSMHEDVTIGRWRIPRGGVVMVSSHVAHMDEGFWNTQDGAHPVHEFWADRFLRLPGDDRTGPMKSNKDMQKPRNQQSTDPSFSLQGLEGFFVPYGGGVGACPGRFLAKQVMLYTCALLVKEFDITILTPDVRMDSAKYGLGTQKPIGSVPFAIKRRASAH